VFLTKEAVRIALPGYGEAIACEGCPPLSRLVEQYRDGGGELLVCPICFNARKLSEDDLPENARLAGATPVCGTGSARARPLPLFPRVLGAGRVCPLA